MAALSGNAVWANVILSGWDTQSSQLSVTWVKLQLKGFLHTQPVHICNIKNKRELRTFNFYALLICVIFPPLYKGIAVCSYSSLSLVTSILSLLSLPLTPCFASKIVKILLFLDRINLCWGISSNSFALQMQNQLSSVTHLIISQGPAILSASVCIYYDNDNQLFVQLLFVCCFCSKFIKDPKINSEILGSCLCYCRINRRLWTSDCVSSHSNRGGNCHSCCASRGSRLVPAHNSRGLTIKLVLHKDGSSLIFCNSLPQMEASLPTCVRSAVPNTPIKPVCFPGIFEDQISMSIH